MELWFDLTNHLLSQEGQTPLMGASYGGSVECVQMLLDRGAQVNVQDKVCACVYVWLCVCMCVCVCVCVCVQVPEEVMLSLCG